MIQPKRLWKIVEGSIKGIQKDQNSLYKYLEDYFKKGFMARMPRFRKLIKQDQEELFIQYMTYFFDKIEEGGFTLSGENSKEHNANKLKLYFTLGMINKFRDFTKSPKNKRYDFEEEKDLAKLVEKKRDVFDDEEKREAKKQLYKLLEELKYPDKFIMQANCEGFSNEEIAGHIRRFLPLIESSLVSFFKKSLQIGSKLDIVFSEIKRQCDKHFLDLLVDATCEEYKKMKLLVNRKGESVDEVLRRYCNRWLVVKDKEWIRNRKHQTIKRIQKRLFENKKSTNHG